MIFGINSFLYGNGNDDNQPIQTYNEEGEVNHKALAERQHKEMEEKFDKHRKRN